MDLADIFKKYEADLCDRVFEYELKGNQIITLIFFREQFCHLLGLQHVYNNDRHYLGVNGLNKILNGKLTVKKLKSHDLKQYNFIKERIENFNLIEQIVNEEELIKFYRDRANPKTNIQADFIFYKENSVNILHLFLRQEKYGKDVYAPVSFVVKSMNDSNAKQFINNQEYKKIVERKVKKKLSLVE